MSAKKISSSKVAPELPAGMMRGSAETSGSWSLVGQPSQIAKDATTLDQELLLVCLQDPFAGIGSASSSVVRVLVPASSDGSIHQWQLESILEMNPPRFFESWATRGSFTLDVKVEAGVAESAGTWGGQVRTATESGKCRLMIMRDLDNKIRFSLASGACQSPEKSMPRPDQKRFLNADVGFELNGPAGVSVGAVSVISSKNWSRLIAGSTAATKGLAFDGKWRLNLSEGDGDAVLQGQWAFAIMTRTAYSTLCMSRGWTERTEG